MTRLIYLVAGFFGGVALAKNAEPMKGASIAGVVAVLIASCGCVWWAAYRGKSQAVANAVAIATASAAAEAQALAMAQGGSVNFHYGPGGDASLAGSHLHDLDEEGQRPALEAAQPLDAGAWSFDQREAVTADRFRAPVED